MKKAFQEPEMTIETFCIEDVITSSSNGFDLDKTELPVI